MENNVTKLRHVEMLYLELFNLRFVLLYIQHNKAMYILYIHGRVQIHNKNFIYQIGSDSA